jgi:beta-glucosidase
VVSGSPLKCESSREYLCNAADSLTTPHKGYNGPAGLGTPNGKLTPFTESKAGDIVSVANPGTIDVQQGVSVSLATKAIDSASGQKLTYSASGLPDGLSINSSTGIISGKVVYVENDTVHVTAKDSTGASATVYFRIEASGSLTADYHAGTGYMPLALYNKDGYSMCMDDTGNKSTSGTKVEIWTCTSNDAQQVWSFQPDTAPGEVADAGLSQLGTIQIHGKCLNIVNNGKTNGSMIQLWTCNGGLNEQWEIAGGYGELVNPVSGKCLEDPYSSTTNGRQLDIWTCNTGDNQNWLPPASPFDSAVSGKCIADNDNSTANGAKIIGYTCDGGTYEKVQVYNYGPYAMLAINGKCLNAVNNGIVNGTTIQLYGCVNGSDEPYIANLWSLNAYSQLENAQADKCLAIPNNSSANGARLELEDCYGRLQACLLPLAGLPAGGGEVLVDYAGHVLAVPEDLARLHPDHPVAALLDLAEVVRDQKDRAGLVAQFLDPVVALGPEGRVTGGERFVDHEDLVALGGRDREPQSLRHTG